MRINTINFIKYKDFSNFTTGMCNYFANRVIRENGIMLGCYINNEPVAVAMIGLVGESCTIYYINVKESFRKRGIANKLILEAIEIGKKHNKKFIDTELVIQHRFGKVAQHTIVKNDFYKHTEFICYSNLINDENHKVWLEFMDKKGQRMIEFAKKRGFSIVSFKNADSRSLDKLKDEVGTLFPKSLSPFLLGNSLIDDISLISVKDEKPIAYIAMDFLNQDLKVISASYAAVASNYRKSPAFCLVLFETISRIFANKSAAKVSSCVEANNKPMIGSYEGIMSPLVSSKKNNLVYRKKLILERGNYYGR